MKKTRFITSLTLLLISLGTLAQTQVQSARWDFNDLTGWTYEHQDTASVSACRIKHGKLLITTRANTRDRQKMHTQKIYREGVYRWRTYIPKAKPYDQMTTGSWIYSDDKHEMDFEVGYGSKKARQECGAKKGEMVACMTCQALPYSTGYTPIKPGWHEFQIWLELVNGKYRIHWIIDDEEKRQSQLEFGPEIAFRIYCSVENLTFIGENIPTRNYTGKYDWVSYERK